MNLHYLIPFSQRRLIFTADAIRDELGHDIMMSWEHPIMKRHAELICEPGFDVLEIGFGMGISASYIQAIGPRRHTIVDCHPQVIERLKVWAQDKPSVEIIEAEWHARLSDLGTYDGILYDIYDDPNVDDFYAKFRTLLKPGGRMTFYNRLPLPDNEVGLPCEYHEVDIQPDPNDYHDSPKYYVPLFRS